MVTRKILNVTSDITKDQIDRIKEILGIPENAKDVIINDSLVSCSNGLKTWIGGISLESITGYNSKHELTLSYSQTISVIP